MTTPLEEARHILDGYLDSDRAYPHRTLDQLREVLARGAAYENDDKAKIERLEHKVRGLQQANDDSWTERNRLNARVIELEAEVVALRIDEPHWTRENAPSVAEQVRDESMQPADPDAPNDTSGLPQETVDRLHREGAEEALTGALHPEFGTEWREPDGVIYKAIEQAKRDGVEEFCHQMATWASGIMNRWPFPVDFQIHTRIINGDYVITQNTPGKQQILATCPYPQYANHVAAALRQFGPLT